MKAFLKAAAVRALRTVAQTAVAVIGTGAVLSDVDWGAAASAALLAGILSLLMSVATGLPEAEGTQTQPSEAGAAGERKNGPNVPASAAQAGDAAHEGRSDA